MELRDVLHQMMQESLAASQPTNLCIGTVTSANPLEVTINPEMGPLKQQVLYRTSAVVEKKIPVLKHKHTTNGFQHRHTLSGLEHSHEAEEGSTGSSLGGSYPTNAGLEQDAFVSDEQLKEIICYEDGRPLPVKDGYIILNRGLEKGDAVLLLRVQSGQKFVILSRVYEKEATYGNSSGQQP